MGYYVYQYLHPEYGHLYCGRTNDLDKRIYEHNNLENDNIPREYEKLLKESIIMYIKLKNKAQGISVEAYCIDKYKPYLNKSLKYDDEKDFVLEMKLPKWKIYSPQKSKYNQQLLDIKKEESQILENIISVKNDIENKKDDLNKLKFESRKIDYEIEIQNTMKDKDILFGLNIIEIEWFYKYCTNKNVKFYSKIYDKVGDISADGCMYYDLDKNTIVLKYWSKNIESNESMIITKKESLFFDTIALTMYDFYPDVNIYPELYAALLSKKDELLIMENKQDEKLCDKMLLKYNV